MTILSTIAAAGGTAGTAPPRSDAYGIDVDGDGTMVVVTDKAAAGSAARPGRAFG